MLLLQVRFCSSKFSLSRMLTFFSCVTGQIKISRGDYPTITSDEERVVTLGLCASSTLESDQNENAMRTYLTIIGEL